MTAAPDSLPATIATAVEHETVIKKSRFIARLEPVSSVEDADAVIARIRKVHWDARHNCVALVVGPRGEQQRSSDDGEPAGTGGIPMLEVLRHRHVTDVVAVVTRYFGGILLGAGGLVRAYSGAVASALDVSDVVRRVWLTEVTVRVPHADAGRIAAYLHEWFRTHDGVLGDVTYAADAVFTMLVPPENLAQFDADLAAASAGSLHAERGEQRIASLT